MFGSKRREIADLKRLIRVQAVKIADTEEDLRAARYELRKATSLFAADPIPERLARALRACARYRRNEAALTRQAAALQERLDHAVGLDSPALDAGAHWQERRTDKLKGATL